MTARSSKRIELTILSDEANDIAEAIRQAVAREVGITISAGVAPNKFLAKIASDWQKPGGLTVIRPDQVDDFVRALPVTKIHGVGKVMATKLAPAAFRPIRWSTMARKWR